MTWLPCPKCGDDLTYPREPSGPLECGCCGLVQAVRRVGGKLEVHELGLPCPRCGDQGTYPDQPTGPLECRGCGERQAVARVAGDRNEVIHAPRLTRRRPPATPPPAARPRGRRARKAWEAGAARRSP